MIVKQGISSVSEMMATSAVIPGVTPTLDCSFITVFGKYLKINELNTCSVIKVACGLFHQGVCFRCLLVGRLRANLTGGVSKVEL